MKLTKTKLKKIILEEVRRVLKEQDAPALNANQMRKMANALCFKQGRVWFGGRTAAESNANMARARRNPQWRCPANKNLGFKDWSDARRLAAGNDPAAFQQFIQSKKGGAPVQQGQQDSDVLYKKWMSEYASAATPELKANVVRKAQRVLENPKSTEDAREAAKIFLKAFSIRTRAAEKKAAANLQGKEAAPQKPELTSNEIERSFDCKLADNAKLGTDWKALWKYTSARKAAGYWNPLAPMTASISRRGLHVITNELLAAAPWLKTNKIEFARGCELPVAKLYKALERQLEKFRAKKRSTPPHTIKYRTEGEYIIATATTKDKKYSVEGKARISFDNEDQAKANAQDRAIKNLIRKTYEVQ